MLNSSTEPAFSASGRAPAQTILVCLDSAAALTSASCRRFSPHGLQTSTRIRPMQRRALCTAVLLMLSIPTRAKEYAAFAPPPEYPAEAMAAHFTGSGAFALHIDPDGHVDRVNTIQSTGHRIPDDAATRAFDRWRFHSRKTDWVLRIPVQYIDGPPRHDAATPRAPQPGYGVLISVFSRHQ